MRIGFSGRVGVGLIVFAVIADGASWVVRAIDNYPFDFYKQSDVYLPLVFLLGLALLLHSLCTAFQSKRAANLAKFPLTRVGPLPPEMPREASQEESRERTARRSAVSSDEIPAPNLAFVPSPSHRRVFKRLGYAFLLLAGLLYVSVQWWVATQASAYPNIAFSSAESYKRLFDVTDLLFYILTAMGITLLLWSDVREAEELSLQGETRATYRGITRVGRILKPLIVLTKPLSSLRVSSYMWLMVLVILWVIFMTITPLTPRGLKVYVPKPGTYAHAYEPWNEPLVVRIDAHHHLYLNRRPMSFAELGPHLELALTARGDRTVFVDAAPNAEVGAVIMATDLILGVGGTKVLLVTPSMKKEMPAFGVMPPCEIEALQEPELRLPAKWRGRWFYDFPLVSFDVSERGDVSNITIEKKGDIPGLDDWVVRSVRKWRFTPTPGCGKPLLRMYAEINPY
jgi:biopolymer transport protein ExbD